jgi:glycosyltransferase involved in cell wall biosynthesis
MPSEPAISVLMPVYNAERYVAEAVESILAQTFRDFEFLIIDDGSTDRSLSILRRYAERDPRISLVSRPNTGYLIALNEMLAMARGEFIARMDADDIALPERFERQLSYLTDHPDCVMIGSRVLVIDPDGSPLTVLGEALTHEEIDSSLMAAHGQMVYHPSVISRRATLFEVGPYRQEYYTGEDLDLFLRLAEVGRIANLAEPLLKYREHAAKVGCVHAAKQEETTRRVLADAYHRRGLRIPPEIVAARSRLPSPIERRRAWGWWALISGNVLTARKHAAACLIRSPLSSHSWRLLYCAIRGY